MVACHCLQAEAEGGKKEKKEKKQKKNKKQKEVEA